jgi:drug/metabolite transporter (DMT)-like permease
VTFLFTALALLAFAANSLLCRLALGGRSIDPASFTTIRLAAGAAMLGTIAVVRSSERAEQRTKNVERRTQNDWLSAIALFAYAITFSLAYVSLPVATGALILFAAVQTTMLVAAIRSGERPSPLEWVGLVVAVAGLLYLVSPGLSAPSITGSLLMIASGAAWGWYSLIGRRSVDPVGDTTLNFIRTVPMTLAVSVMSVSGLHVTQAGALFAALSGAITSGLGYVVWYAALARLTATRAATVQLATPALTATGGVLFLSEQVSARLGLSAALILGGIAIAVFSRLRAR